MRNKTNYQLLVLFTICLGYLFAQPQNFLQPLDLFQVRYAEDPQISLDGKKIYYVRNFADIITNEWYSNIWCINADGSDHYPISPKNSYQYAPRLSPKGDKLAYISYEEDGLQIYVYSLIDKKQQKISRLENAVHGIAWSPDGDYLSFSSFVPSPTKPLITMPKLPENAQWGEQPKEIDTLTYRADGKGYSQKGYWHLFIISSQGGVPQQITSGNIHFGGNHYYSAGEASWTHDAKSLLISANCKNNFEYEPLDNEIYEIKVEDHSIKRLTYRKGPDNFPIPSPDGKYIAYLGFDDSHKAYQIYKLYIMNKDGTQIRELSKNFDRSISRIQWDKNSRRIFFRYNDKGKTKIAYYTLEGQMVNIAENLGTWGSTYNYGGGYSVATDGTYVFNYTDAHNISELALGRIASENHPKIITDLNSTLLKNRQLAEVKEIWYNSSWDQEKIQGWIMTPPNFDPSKKYPLILEIHGGPYYNYGSRFSFMKQIWAAQGYVVFYCNPRGSTSYGQKFIDLIHHKFPQNDHHDLLSGVDAVIAKGYVDENNLFITGGSGGGLLTCWTISHSERFRAAVAAYPVIDWKSLALTTDIPITMTKYWFPGFPWEYPLEYSERSPISRVHKVKTPTMIITGEADYRTPIAESEQYFCSLKLLNIDTMLVRVPDESHDLEARPGSLITKTLYTIGWFEKYRQK